VTGFPEQPTSTSDGDISTPEVVGEPAERDEAPDLPGEVPERSVPDQKSAPGTSETMPPSEGVFEPDRDPSAPD
jgi:hypothetical protein